MYPCNGPKFKTSCLMKIMACSVHEVRPLNNIRFASRSHKNIACNKWPHAIQVNITFCLSIKDVFKKTTFIIRVYTANETSTCHSLSRCCLNQSRIRPRKSVSQWIFSMLNWEILFCYDLGCPPYQAWSSPQGGSWFIVNCLGCSHLGMSTGQIRHFL